MRSTPFLAVILFVLGWMPAQSGPKPEEAPEPGKHKPLDSRVSADFLPAILEKALAVEAQREIISLKYFVKIFRVWEEGGLVNPVNLARVQQELARSTIRKLKQEAKFQDLLDTLGLRYQVAIIGPVETETLQPLFAHMAKIEDIFVNNQILLKTLLDLEKEKPGEIRKKWGGLVAKSGVFPMQSREKVFDYMIKKNNQELRTWEIKARKERRQLQDEKVDLELENKPLSLDKRKRLAVLDFELDALRFERLLRAYENLKGPGKAGNQWKYEPGKRRMFVELYRAFRFLAAFALAEKMKPLRTSWPRVEPIVVGGQDLLRIDWLKAEGWLAKKLPKKEKFVQAKISWRRLRTFSKIYQLEQELVVNAYLLKEQALDAFTSIPTPKKENSIVSSVPQFEQPNSSQLTEELLRNNNSLWQARKHLIRTWMDYQALRLELIGKLKLDQR